MMCGRPHAEAYQIHTKLPSVGSMKSERTSDRTPDRDGVATGAGVPSHAPGGGGSRRRSASATITTTARATTWLWLRARRLASSCCALCRHPSRCPGTSPARRQHLVLVAKTRLLDHLEVLKSVGDAVIDRDVAPPGIIRQLRRQRAPGDLLVGCDRRNCLSRLTRRPHGALASRPCRGWF